MTTSRAESQHSSQYGRRRSNTAQSVLRPTPVTPLKVGDSNVLNTWVHEIKDDAKETHSVVFNQSWWPGVAEGDLLSVKGGSSDKLDSAFLFIVPKDDGCSKPQLQISIPKPIADVFRLRNNSEVTVTKVDRNDRCADYVEFVFQDQYLGRNDMWRLGRDLVGQCIYADQQVTFVGSIAAKIQNIYISGKTASSAYVTSATKAIYRSQSARMTIFIQVCRELWEFAGDGERYYEKIVHSYLPALFSKWQEAGTNHIVTIVLISRVFYEDSEINYAAGPLRQDDYGKWYKDFFKVITDLEVMSEWKPTLVGLKDSFWAFQRDILLTHHYHQSTLDVASIGPPAQVRLVGRISFAHDGPILEAINLALNPTETHYIDRSLSLTGTTIVLITPGTGYFRVPKDLLRLTTTRLLDQGFLIDLVSLAKPPLHQSPVFSFQSAEPKPDADGKYTLQSADPLLVSAGEVSGEKKTFWWEPFWVSITFWDKQMDLPFRSDRFIGRAKMHQIQMLGLLELDVLSSIEVPFLPEPTDLLSTKDTFDDAPLSKLEADRFDMDIFILKPESKVSNITRDLLAPSNNGLAAGAAYRNPDKRNSHRNSVMLGKIDPIEESPKPIQLELPEEDLPSKGQPQLVVSGLNKSPSQSSIMSLRSNLSASSKSARANPETPLRPSLASKLAPSWLFNPFRSVPSEPQTSPVSASASSISHNRSKEKLPPSKLSPRTSSPIRMPIVAKPATPYMTHSPIAPSPLPMTIRNSAASNRAGLSRTFEDDALTPHRASYIRRSPLGTPPRDELTFSKRRSVASIPTSSFTSSSPGTVSNPSRLSTSVSHAHASLARRWQHMFPQVTTKHEVKWKTTVVPVCLPLTVEHFPTTSELESLYDVFSYVFVIDPGEMRSFLVKPPSNRKSQADLRRAWALAVMRGMAAVRLAQGFQFILCRPSDGSELAENSTLRRTKSLMTEEELTPKPIGASDVLRSPDDPVYLSMSNEIHRISYTGEAIQVRRYVRQMPASQPFLYQCLMWPKLGGGYTELSTKFSCRGLENYGWNRLDMLVAGYEHNFNESLRYWRTRFVVIPTAEPPTPVTGPNGESLDEEETRILGIEKLAEQFTKLRWQSAEEKATYTAPPVRLLPTTLGPALSVRDASLMDQLDQIHAAGPLRKKMNSQRDLGDLSLGAISRAMREEDGVPIKDYHWHRIPYNSVFIGYDLVSWLVREFRDVSSRAQATEWGVKLQEQGLFEHCRGYHSFLDGHYFYRLKGEYSVATTPKGWFRRYTTEDPPRANFYPASVARPKNPSPRRHKKRIILSQSMVIDIDPNRKSDQAESVILHHDIIHNPGTAFHFELQWIGTTARCIEDLIRQWGRTIDRYGLRLVEAYVSQISDIRERNAFQSCFPMRLVIAPPIVMDIEKCVPEGTQTTHYFEYALLKKFGYILDVEAAALYPEQVDVVYSYRRSAYKHTQFVHRSGMGFVQVLGGSQGFLFLTNRLTGSGRMAKNMDSRQTATVDDIRLDLYRFVSDKQALLDFYEDELTVLRQYQSSEEPPLPAAT